MWRGEQHSEEDSMQPILRELGDQVPYIGRLFRQDSETKLDSRIAYQCPP